MNDTPPRYRILDPREIVQAGDEVSLMAYGCSEWVRAGLVGMMAQGGRYRRLAPSNVIPFPAVEENAQARGQAVACDTVRALQRDLDEAKDIIEAQQRELADVRASQERLSRALHRVIHVASNVV